MDQPQPMSSGSGNKSNAWLAYLLGWITGLIMFFTGKDEYTRFHAAQSILLFGGLNVLSIVLSWIFFRGYGSMMSMMYLGGNPLYSLLQLVAFVLWILLMVKAHKGEKYKLPFLGDLAEQWAKKH